MAAEPSCTICQAVLPCALSWLRASSRLTRLGAALRYSCPGAGCRASQQPPAALHVQALVQCC